MNNIDEMEHSHSKRPFLDFSWAQVPLTLAIILTPILFYLPILFPRQVGNIFFGPTVSCITHTTPGVLAIYPARHDRMHPICFSNFSSQEDHFATFILAVLVWVLGCLPIISLGIYYYLRKKHAKRS